MDIQDVRDTSRREAAQGTELGIAVNLTWLGGVDALHGIIIPILPHKDASSAAFERCRRHAGMFQDFPTDF